MQRGGKEKRGEMDSTVQVERDMVLAVASDVPGSMLLQPIQLIRCH